MANKSKPGYYIILSLLGCVLLGIVILIVAKLLGSTILYFGEIIGGLAMTAFAIAIIGLLTHQNI